MNTNPATIDDAIDDLVRERHLIERAIDGLEALKQLYGGGRQFNPAPQAALPASSNTPAATPIVKKRKYERRAKTGPAATDSEKPNKCRKHPGTPTMPSGRCRKCGAESMAKWSAKKKKNAAPKASPDDKLHELANANRPKASADVSTPPVHRRARALSEATDELEYSKPMTCPKCHATNIRFSRPEDFDPMKDSWTCLANRCQLRIAHVNLAVDRGYESEI